MPNNIGQKIKELRLKRGWSQEYLANKIGIGQQYISKYESGKMYPSLKTLLKLADVFEVSIEFSETKEAMNLTDKKIKDKGLTDFLLNEINNLNEEDSFTIKNVIEALIYRKKHKK